jgi:ribonuclease P protein component
MRLRLGAKLRIKRSGSFRRAKEQGRRLTVGCLTVNWLPTTPGTQHQLGVITSRKLGNAVCRNRARRLLREVFRQHQHELKQPLTLVLVARPSIVGKTFSLVQSDFMSALRRANLLKEAP